MQFANFSYTADGSRVSMFWLEAQQSLTFACTHACHLAASTGIEFHAGGPVDSVGPVIGRLLHAGRRVSLFGASRPAYVILAEVSAASGRARPFDAVVPLPPGLILRTAMGANMARDIAESPVLRDIADEWKALPVRAVDPHEASLLRHALLVLKQASLPSRERGAVADRVGVSRARLEHAFQRQLGLSVDTYRRESRVRSAGFDLLSSRLRVEDIARRYGYRSASHLGADFRAVFGVPPSRLVLGLVRELARI